MKKASFVSLWFFVFCAFLTPQASGQNDSWEWYESQTFCLRQAIAEMAGLYAPKEPLTFIKELFAGFQKTEEEQNTFATLKLRIVNNEGLVEEIISEYTNFKGYHHRCFIQKREINFFFPSNRSFIFGIEEKGEKEKIAVPSLKKEKTTPEPKAPGFKKQERTDSAKSEKPTFSRFSREEQPVP